MVFKQNKLILYLFMLIFLIAGIFIIFEGDSFLGGAFFIFISLAGIYFVTKLENSVEFTNHSIKIEKRNKAITEIPYDNIHSSELLMTKVTSFLVNMPNGTSFPRLRR